MDGTKFKSESIFHFFKILVFSYNASQSLFSGSKIFIVNRQFSYFFSLSKNRHITFRGNRDQITDGIN